MQVFISERAAKLLEHIWADLKGPLLDEKSRFTTVYPLQQKSDASSAFQVYEARAERVTGNKIISLHVDGDGEFMSNNCRDHCQNRGIGTQPYSPEMNGIAERMMCLIVEHASAMLRTACLPIGFWAAIVKTSVFLTNHSPSAALDITLFEAYFRCKPNLGFLRVWGCRAAAHIPEPKRIGHQNPLHIAFLSNTRIQKTSTNCGMCKRVL